MDIFDKILISFFGLLFIFAVGLLIFVIALGTTHVLTEKKCLEMGYTTASIDYKLNKYCKTRKDQTDIVVPLKEAKHQ